MLVRKFAGMVFGVLFASGWWAWAMFSPLLDVDTAMACLALLVVASAPVLGRAIRWVYVDLGCIVERTEGKSRADGICTLEPIPGCMVLNERQWGDLKNNMQILEYSDKENTESEKELLRLLHSLRESGIIIEQLT